jgi:hypothetical protein
MSRYHDLIVGALETMHDAPATRLDTNVGLSSFTSLADDDLLPPTPSEWWHPPGMAAVEEVEELQALFDALRDVTSIETNPADIEGSIRHERQHDTAARLLGLRAAVYGINFVATNEGQTDIKGTGIAEYGAFQAGLGFSASKLSTALIHAYPVERLQGDIVDIKRLGYRGGIQEVGALAHERNTKAGEYLWPIPHTYDPMERYLTADDSEFVRYRSFSGQIY